MDDLLFLAHRIPYPPNKGDKIRSFHLLDYLSTRYRVHLGAFVDSPADLVHRDVVREYCASVWLGRLSPRRAKLRSLTGLLTGEALTLPYYRGSTLPAWIRDVTRDQAIRRVLVYSSAMAQFVIGPEFASMRRVIDFVDMDSDKWRQYSLSQRFPLSWIYRRESRRLLAFERTVATRFDTSLFISPQEAALFAQSSGVEPSSLRVLRNGVDTAYFSVDPARPSPFMTSGPHLVFTGAMDYWANVEGVEWFVESILPAIRHAIPGVEFHIVGMNPAPRVQGLARTPGVRVTGGVPDIRPYVQHASVVVVPLRIARGIQNKVLEAMSMARPVVATTQALEGIPATDGQNVRQADEPNAFARRVIEILTSEEGARLGGAARALIERDFVWKASLRQLDEVLNGD
ncbi:TIGR03087 family PEP-CTERM/XrtA system glycosyltransferase [Allochromatium vinosum]|uniref:Sugar transferase, PEP-CTERM/EpsH1 system associated n=1 Tax=Allochromatium vinosum (strain ATCC 17899 / DSM 180 / NBRC 103801 / NCIMB 10441 / D) TaxID=572477 RepID=D3RU51_ALLVD|nr:TIGR03087 family PEP-CTERM/XrtA system glycosyltransferase [Allochromatium vinosum]ADC62710.1 sugar transferase, PEP-CTERM/EpsH1 system associated [Allochromatium vinosum DSM 180]